MKSVCVAFDTATAFAMSFAGFAFAGIAVGSGEFTDFIRATFGVRREEATQSVQTFDRFGNLGAGTVDLENDYTLPAFTGTSR